jgi:hypothetical protein
MIYVMPAFILTPLSSSLLKIHHFLFKTNFFYIDMAHSTVYTIINSSSKTSLSLSKNHHKLLRCKTPCFMMEEHKFSI